MAEATDWTAAYRVQGRMATDWTATYRVQRCMATDRRRTAMRSKLWSVGASDVSAGPCASRMGKEAWSNPPVAGFTQERGVQAGRARDCT